MDDGKVYSSADTYSSFSTVGSGRPVVPSSLLCLSPLLFIAMETLGIAAAL